MPSRAEISTGEALIGLLEAYGVDTVFGIPGVHNVEMYRALPRSKIHHVLVRHEQGAGFMADGYARATGRPGVCFTITGPGLTNILTPMGQAWSDSSSMLVISSALDMADSAQGRGRLHEMIDQRMAAASVTGLHMRAYTPKDVRDGLARAFSHFASQRPRPAYLEIPLDMLKSPAGDGWHARPLPRRARPQADQIAAAVARLSNAQRPLIILGGAFVLCMAVYAILAGSGLTGPFYGGGAQAPLWYFGVVGLDSNAFASISISFHSHSFFLRDQTVMRKATGSKSEPTGFQ